MVQERIEVRAQKSRERRTTRRCPSKHNCDLLDEASRIVEQRISHKPNLIGPTPRYNGLRQPPGDAAPTHPSVPPARSCLTVQLPDRRDRSRYSPNLETASADPRLCNTRFCTPSTPPCILRRARDS